MNRRAIAVAALLVIGSACAQDAGRQTADPTDAAPSDSAVEALPAAITDGAYEPDIDPADFTDEIDNPYLPWNVGSTWHYEGRSEDGVETIEVTVTDEKKKVMGIDVVVVRDEVKVDGERVELTDDWYAQDADGNVWYMGEDSGEYEDGKKINSAGSWEAGVDGALPGIVMPADPQVGQKYRQEFYEGEAEDTGEVIKVGERVTVEAGSYDDVVVTEDLNPFEPEIVENKYFAKDVGLVMEQKVKGSDEKVELVEFDAG